MMNSERVEAKTAGGPPAWVMTFADLMSLLLAFFVLLFSFSEMDKHVYKELAGSMKDAFGVQREIKVRETPRGINIIAREFSPGRPVPTALNEVRQMTTDDSKLHPVFTDPAKDGQENMSEQTVEAQDKPLIAMQGNGPADANVKLSDEELEHLEQVKKDSALAREIFEEEINQGLIELEVAQKRIILRVREKGSFPSGSAQLMEPFKVVADKVSKVFTDFNGTVIVSGHTDNVPINTYRFRSNWELSSSRAVSVLHELAKNEALKKKHFVINAYADTQPVDSNKTAEARAKNRRVEITMDYSTKRVEKPLAEDDVVSLNKALLSEHDL